MADHDESVERTSSNPIPDRDEDDEAQVDAARQELGGAYGEDDTPMPTSTAETLGNPPRGQARYETKFEHDEQEEGDDER